jgi:hypothetical protein
LSVCIQAHCLESYFIVSTGCPGCLVSCNVKAIKAMPMK